MSGRHREPQGAEGWESLSQEEESGGSLAPNPELEEALREAAAALEGPGQRRGAPRRDLEVAGEPPAETAALEAEVERLRKELGESKDRLIRLQADFENFRRRSIKDRQEVLAYGHENLVKDLLATVDNLDRAIDHARKSEVADPDALLQGVELVQRELLTALSSHGVSEIEAEGRSFDPALHEAMAHEPDESVPPGTVIEVLQKGYLLKDRLLRPARVKVAKAPAAGAGGPEPGTSA